MVPKNGAAFSYSYDLLYSHVQLRWSFRALLQHIVLLVGKTLATTNKKEKKINEKVEGLDAKLEGRSFLPHSWTPFTTRSACLLSREWTLATRETWSWRARKTRKRNVARTFAANCMTCAQNHVIARDYHVDVVNTPPPWQHS